LDSKQELETQYTQCFNDAKILKKEKFLHNKKNITQVIQDKELKNYLIVLEILKKILIDFDKKDIEFYQKIK